MTVYFRDETGEKQVPVTEPISASQLLALVTNGQVTFASHAIRVNDRTVLSGATVNPGDRVVATPINIKAA